MQSRMQALRARMLPESEFIPQPVLAGLEKAEGDGLKNRASGLNGGRSGMTLTGLNL